ncbi:suppressor of cytokine signaling 2 [Caerostris extrusa]|uniref:Suppressor of cytokine signaling 2 n=1 Tax=Caerostris extrusa TaxID=172846 RepID=A0AAV4XW74_CAEEX|nr:suppressor of cytokine signaling 2 [Caerostris extrusa]
MNQIEPEDDLRSLVYNDQQLNLCGYYYGNLSWLDSSQLLRSTAEGTFLVRDSEHGSYLYTLSVQTSKGPTSCRIEYIDGRFRLDSAKSLSHKMPFFDCVPHLIDYYVQLSQSLPGKKSFSPIWLNMDEENTMNVPVKIFKPRYRQVRGLMHMCRVEMAKHLKVNHTAKAVFRTMDHPSNVVSRTIEQDSKYKDIPKLIKDYLKHYPYSQ